MNPPLRSRERAADLEARPQPAERLDRAAGLGDDVLHDREAEARPARGACAVGAEEALEEPPELGLLDTDAVVRAAKGHGVADPLDGAEVISRRAPRTGSRSP